MEYKHKFRKIIASELERNEWLKSYFDDWGNRCYLFFSEIPGYFNVEKDTSGINGIRLDTDALQEMGCDYIFCVIYRKRRGDWVRMDGRYYIRYRR